MIEVNPCMSLPDLRIPPIACQVTVTLSSLFIFLTFNNSTVHLYPWAKYVLVLFVFKLLIPGLSPFPS